jgi:hypothetical protein
LSLAHAELAEVFFNKVLVTTWNTGNPVMIVVGFAMWCARFPPCMLSHVFARICILRCYMGVGFR